MKRFNGWYGFIIIVFLLSGCLGEEPPVAPCYPSTKYFSNSNNQSSTETYTYDSKNRVATVVTQYTDESGSSMIGSTYSYHSDGHIEKRQYDDGRYTLYRYNEDNLIDLITPYSSEGAPLSQSEFLFNTSSQVTRHQIYFVVDDVLTKGDYYLYEYGSNKGQNPSKKTYYNVSDVKQFEITYTYDDKRNPDSVPFRYSPTINSHNLLSYTYAPVSGDGYSITYSYDYTDSGFPRYYTMTYSSGDTENYSYDYNNCY